MRARHTPGDTSFKPVLSLRSAVELRSGKHDRILNDDIFVLDLQFDNSPKFVHAQTKELQDRTSDNYTLGEVVRALKSSFSPPRGELIYLLVPLH